MTSTHIFLPSAFFLLSLFYLSLSIPLSFCCCPADELDAIGDETDSMLARREEEEDVNVGDQQ